MTASLMLYHGSISQSDIISSKHDFALQKFYEVKEKYMFSNVLKRRNRIRSLKTYFYRLIREGGKPS